VIHKDGHTLWWHSNPTPLVCKNKIVGFTAVIHDITEKKRAEKELQQSEIYYRSLIENALDGVMIVNGEGIIQYQSPADEHILGYKPEARVSKSLFGKVHPEERSEITEAFNQLIRTKGFTQPLFLRVQHNDGSWRTLDGIAKNLIDNPAVRGVVINYRDVTDRKLAEAALQESEEKYRLLIENAQEGIVVAQDGVLKFVNPAVLDALGYSEAEFTSRSFLEFIHPDDRETVAAYHTKRLKGAEAPSSYPCRVVAKEGNIVWAELSSVLITWEGRPATLTFIVNITERKKAEDTLRAKEQEQQLILNSVPLGIFHLDTDSNYIHVNKVLAERYGYQSEYFIGKSTRDIFPEEADGYTKTDRELLESGKPQIGVMTRFKTPKGERWMRLDKVPLKDAEGNVSGIIGFELDITDRKLAEDALRESGEKYRTLVENIQDGVFILQGNPPRLVFCNEAFAGMVGYTVDEAMELGFDEYVAPEDLARVASRYRQRQAGEDVSQEYEYCALHKDGKTRVCINMNVGLIEYHGKVASLGTVKDVTKRRLAEQALRESEEKLAQIVQGSPNPSFVIDKNHRITHWNKACERLTGIPAAEMVGTNKQWSIFYPKERQIMADFVVDNQPEDVIASTYGNIYRTSDLVEGAYEGLDLFPSFGDSGKWFFFTAAPLKDSNGHTVGALETLLDLTELKRAEEQIKASLVEKELLLQEIHHRVKNNMQVISSLLNLQSRRIKDKGALEMFKATQSRVKSMALIHEKLYESGDIVSIDFADYIRSLISNLFQSYQVNPKDVNLTTAITVVALDITTAIPCGLIINELIANALKHAFPDGKKGQIHIAMHPLDGDAVELIVRDTGIGFPEALDFRNTKSLGMQLVISLVEGQLGGSIELDRSAGTTFKIKFSKGTNGVV
jgi:PAS domain S-box-containing protein